MANSFIRGLVTDQQYNSNGEKVPASKPDCGSDIHLYFRATNMNKCVICTPPWRECRSMPGVINLIHLCNVERQGLIWTVWIGSIFIIIFFFILTCFRSIIRHRLLDVGGAVFYRKSLNIPDVCSWGLQLIWHDEEWKDPLGCEKYIYSSILFWCNLKHLDLTWVFLPYATSYLYFTARVTSYLTARLNYLLWWKIYFTNKNWCFRLQVSKYIKDCYKT